jgi:hypothetical protein
VNVLKNQIVVARREINGECCKCPEKPDCREVFCIQTVCKDGKARREINGECCKCPEEIK